MVVKRATMRAVPFQVARRAEFSAQNLRGGARLVNDWSEGLPAGTPSLGVLLPPEWRERYAVDKDHVTYVVVSWETPIAWVVQKDGQESVVIPDVQYGPSTSRHQNLARAGFAHAPAVTAVPSRRAA